MKIFKKILIIICLIPCIFLFNACTQNKGIDGEDFSMEMLKEYAAELGYTDFNKFLKDYFTIQYINSEKSDIQNATNLAIQSAVTIWAEFPITNVQHEGTPMEQSIKDVSISRGAGVIYKKDLDYSYIVTNYHVVYNTNSDTSNNIARYVNIFQYGADESAYDTKTIDNQGYPKIEYGEGAILAEFIGGAMNYDLAVLKVPTLSLETFNPNVKEVDIADSYNLGETTIAIGNPEGEGFSVTSGIVSVVSEEIKMLGADDKTPCTFRVMRTDTAVNGGNSGGGLFNNKGELIGIVNAKAIASEIDNIAYAIPCDNVSAVADNIICYHKTTNNIAKVKKLVLGINYYVVNNKALYNPETNTTTLTDNIKVVSIDDNSIASKYNFQENDLIHSIIINNKEFVLTNAYELGDLLLTIRDGDTISFKVTRNNSIISLEPQEEFSIKESQLTVVE